MYLNIDINSRCSPFFDSLSEKEHVSEADVLSFLDIYTDSSISDILFNIFTQYSAVETEIWSSYADKYEQTSENGIPVDYKAKHRGLYRLNKIHHLDPYKLWFEECKNRGINPWISIRMNDCHCPNDETGFLRSDFFYQAKEEGWMLGDEYKGSFKICLNYAVPQVRAKFLAYIEEQLGKYDVYGLELDFMREIMCFDYLNIKDNSHISIMNDFIRQVKKITTHAELLWGHPIKIAVRLNRDINQSRIFGFDARTWADESLIDIIIPSPRWDSSDSRMPICEWKRELPNITIIPCIETVFSSSHGGYAFATTELTRGIIGGYLSDGADTVYLYNYFAEKQADQDYFFYRDIEVYKTCGSIEELIKHPVRYAVAEQEASMCPRGMQPDRPLPIELNGTKEEITINTAILPSDKNIFLILGFTDGSARNISVKVNGVVYNNFVPVDTPEPKNAMPANTKCYQCSISHGSSGPQLIEFSGSNAVISWIEIYVS